MTSNSVFAGNFALNFFLAGSLNSLWSLIESQQLVVVMPLFNVILPANAGIIFSVLMNIAAFDPIDAEVTVIPLLDLEETGPYESKFDVLGFESLFCLANMGTQAILITLSSTLVSQSLFSLWCIQTNNPLDAVTSICNN